MASPGRDSSARLKTWGRVSEEHGEQEGREGVLTDEARRTLEMLLHPFRRRAERAEDGRAEDLRCCYGTDA